MFRAPRPRFTLTFVKRTSIPRAQTRSYRTTANKHWTLAAFLDKEDEIKHTGRFLVRLLILTTGVLSIALLNFSTGVVAAKRAARLGKQVWVFEWRNPLRQSPQIALQPASPL